ncbi:phospholipid phosphatase 1-like [Mercenaria mercenaria]|uniref:phospholipid phosphatase 1-like n=1 Tax=Mercenaria mercenaria TaxID=6596 RepID=UPI00234FB2C3|nr:phospholipid phosphatase 1-like [Mercenaria mercenaria]
MTFIKSTSVFTVIAEVTLWLLMSVLTLLLSYNLIGVEPFRRGFFCDDETIRYPYKDDTVSDTMVAVIFVVVPIIIMIITETVHIVSIKSRQEKGSKVLVQKFSAKFYRTVGAFLFATLCTMFLTETMKLFGGRLRPHFVSLCKPDFSKLNCSQGYIMIHTGTCTADVTRRKLLDARKSFPSGHASLSAFGAIYLLVYLQLRFIWTQKIRILLPLIQVGIICASAFVCISRVNDNKHHFGDVIAGAILGTVLALLALKYVSCIRRNGKHVSHYLPDTVHDTPTSPVLTNTSPARNGQTPNTVVEMKDV